MRVGGIVLAIAVALLLALPAGAVHIMTPSHYVTSQGIAHAYEVLYELYNESKVPEKALDMVLHKITRANFTATGNITKQISFKGLLDRVVVKITACNGTVHVYNVSCCGETKEVNVTLSPGQNVTVELSNLTTVVPPVQLKINANASYCFEFELHRMAYMLMDGCVASVSPIDGVYFQSYKSWSKPIPMFVKPRSAEVAVAVNVYNPNASTADTYVNVTLSSAVHDNVVDVVLTDVPFDSLDLYIDGKYVTTLNVTNGTVYFNVTGFSTKDVSLIVSGALAVPPEEIDWQKVAAAIILAFLFGTLIYLAYATIRGR